MKRKSRCVLSLLTSCVLALALALPALGAEIKIALDCPPDPDKCGTYLWSKTFSDFLTEKGLETNLYPRDALGAEEEKLDQVAQGLLEISNSDLAKAGQLDPTIFGMYLPFLFEDIPHFYRTLEQTDVLPTINKGTTPKGVRVLSIIPLGGMVGIATTKKFVKTPSDFDGLRMRALDKKQAKWLKIWGANSVIIPWAEIYNSLQTGVADGYLNPAFVPVMFKHTEVLKYFSVANLAPSLRTSLCSEDWYQGLSDQDRTIVDEGVRVADAAVKAWAIEADKAAIAGLKEAGMDVYHNTAEEKAEFADLIRPQYSEILGSEELADFFVQAAGASR